MSKKRTVWTMSFNRFYYKNKYHYWTYSFYEDESEMYTNKMSWEMLYKYLSIKERAPKTKNNFKKFLESKYNIQFVK